MCFVAFSSLESANLFGGIARGGYLLTIKIYVFYDAKSFLRERCKGKSPIDVVFFNKRIAKIASTILERCNDLSKGKVRIKETFVRFSSLVEKPGVFTTILELRDFMTR